MVGLRAVDVKLSYQSSNQSINKFDVLGCNRQEVQFSEFRQTKFASYMQSIPFGLHKVIQSAMVQQAVITICIYGL